jgi:hypothetical protein
MVIKFAWLVEIKFSGRCDYATFQSVAALRASVEWIKGRTALLPQKNSAKIAPPDAYENAQNLP